MRPAWRRLLDSGAGGSTFKLPVFGIWSDTVGRVLVPNTRMLATINGRSWPHTERFDYTVGDTIFAAARRERVNTAGLLPGATATMTWVPERAGNWLFHCHIPEHFKPRGSLGLPRTSSKDDDASHDAAMHHAMNHALEGMNGLVTGVTVRSRAGSVARAEDGATLDSARDHVVLITSMAGTEAQMRAVLLNGSVSPPPMEVRAGVAQRLRLINITANRPNIRVEVWRGDSLIAWRPLAKDGADLPDASRVTRVARTPISIGETMDFQLVVDAPGTLRLEVRAATGVLLATMPIEVRAEH